MPQSVFRDSWEAKARMLEAENARLRAKIRKLEGPSFRQRIKPVFVDWAVAINIVTALFFALLLVVYCLEFICMMGFALLGIWVQWTLPTSSEYMTCPVYGCQVSYYGDTVAEAIYPPRYGH